MSRKEFIRLWKKQSEPAKTKMQADAGYRRLYLEGSTAISAFKLFESKRRPKYPDAKVQYDPTPGRERFLVVARPFEITDVVH